MSFPDILSDTSSPSGSQALASIRKSWIGLVYLLSVVLACILTSRVTTLGSVFTTVIVASLLIMPTLVLMIMLRRGSRDCTKTYAEGFASAPSDAEWVNDDSGDDVEVRDVDTAVTERNE